MNTNFKIRVTKAINLPKDFLKNRIRANRYYVIVKLLSSSTGKQFKSQVAEYNHETESCTFNYTFDLSLNGEKEDEVIKLTLMRAHNLKYDSKVGSAVVNLKDVHGTVYQAMIFDEKEKVIANSSTILPLVVLLDGSDNAQNSQSPIKTFPKHIMMITRGTRGDVQPFVALARGLAENHGWRVTICTETSYKSFVEKHSHVKNGVIDFRPTGGDTQVRVESPICQLAIKQKNTLLQFVILAASEYEFFESEPAIFYWASTLRPDYCIFGFTTATITMLISEALQIPILGLILQPTCIPSSAYPPIFPIDQHRFEQLSDNQLLILKKHEELSYLKAAMDGNYFTNRLGDFRKRRGLPPMKFHFKEALLGFPAKYKINTFRLLKASGIPLVVPMSEEAFGERPKDYPETIVFTDFIFLRGKTLPELDRDHARFIEEARSLKRKVVAMSMGSMPVSKSKILKCAVKIVEKTKSDVAVIALLGPHYNESMVKHARCLHKPYSSKRKLLNKVAELVSSGRLLIARGSPFGRLFPLVDVVVGHGGLGTTAEAILAEKPVIVTGVLLLDQRFWGTRCYEMDIGPFPLHIRDFQHKCAELVDAAVSPSSPWKENAMRIGKKLKAIASSDPDGTKRNSESVVMLLNAAKVWNAEDSMIKSQTNHLNSN